MSPKEYTYTSLSYYTYMQYYWFTIDPSCNTNSPNNKITPHAAPWTLHKAPHVAYAAAQELSSIGNTDFNFTQHILIL